MTTETGMGRNCPVEKANLFSRVFYSWMNPLLKISRGSYLKVEDIFASPLEEETDYNTRILRHYWNEERKKRKPSLFAAVFRAQWVFIIYSAITLFSETVCLSIRPSIMNKILSGFSDMSNPYLRTQAIIYCAILILTTLIALFLRNSSFWMTYRMGMRLRVSASGLVFEKILKLNQKAMTGTASGQIINLLSTDAQRFELSFMFMHYGWIAPIQAILVFWLMGEITFYPTLCAAAVMIFFIPMQSLMNHAYARIKFRICRVSDARIRILSDIINGIKIIKLHAWETLFARLVHEFRRKETRLFLNVRLCQAFQFTQLVYQVKLTTMAMLLAIVLLHDGDGDPTALHSSELYTLLNYLNSLFLTLTLFFPMCIQYLYDTSVSCLRIQRFLEIPEIEGELVPDVMDKVEKPMIEFDHVTARWDNDTTRPTLSDVCFELYGPCLVAVVGAVGSGKSSLLQAALGELPFVQGKLKRSADVGYMPQISWIFPGTVRENVVCSLPFDAERYKAVLKATTLDVDLIRLQYGDKTQVGERGVSLSGGQKARVCLARLAYDQNKLVLIDDPLAAVDASVGSHLFNKCICEYMSDRLRILVTHQHHLLTKVDKILVMREGQITHIGTHDELVALGVDFVDLTREDTLETTDGTPPPETSNVNNPNQLQQYDSTSIKLKEQSRGRMVTLRGSKYFQRSSQFNTQSYRRIDKKISRQEEDLDCQFMTASLSNLENPVTDYSETEIQFLNSTGNLCRPGGERQSIRSWSAFKRKRESIASRLAFSMENALCPGSINAEPDLDDGGAISELYEYEDEEEERDVEEKWEEGRPEEEKLQRGSVSWRHYIILGRIGGGICGIITSLLLFAATITNFVGCDVWLTKWSSIVDYRNLTALNISGSDPNAYIPWDMGSNRFSLYIYCALTVILVVVSSLRSLSLFSILINSAKRLHDGMLRACLNTRLTFFELNTSGRILNRFSKDIGQLDDILPTTLHDFLQCFSLVCGLIVVTIVSSYYILFPTIPLMVLFYYTRRYYLYTSRDLKRIESIARSPVFSWVNVTVQGLPCVRASRNEEYQVSVFNKVMDFHTSVFYVNMAAARWLSIRLDLLCLLFIATVTVVCLLVGIFSSVSSADVGLMITYATTLIGLFQWCVRQSAEVENQMVSVERTVEYMDLEPELTAPPVLDPPEEWPKEGVIIFDDLWLRYAETAPWALKGITLTVPSGSKVGIVGRTGAGKSSLISAIFRIVEAEQGSLLVDGVDVAHVNLKELRKRISIIPQDPIMFSGTIRSNLDPNKKLTDVVLWQALASVQLQKEIAYLNGSLDAPITEGGSNFSTGQRQLIALARAILGGNQILVVDEATANVDPGTDAIIQKTLRVQFSKCTVLTVAHRLHTVIDNDSIVVMDSGRIVEVGSPYELLSPESAYQDRRSFRENRIPNVDEMSELAVTGHGPLADLVKETGSVESTKLTLLARKAYIKRFIGRPSLIYPE